MIQKTTRSGIIFLAVFLAVVMVGTTLGLLFGFPWRLVEPTGKNVNQPITTVDQKAQELTSDNVFAEVPVLQLREDESLSGILYLFKRSSLVSHDIRTKKESTVVRLDSSSTLADFSQTRDEVAYVRTSGDLDELVLHNLSSGQSHVLLQAFHGYTGLDEVQNSILRMRPRFSPAGKYVVAEKTFWEWCAAYLIDTTSRETVSQRGCNALFWSGDDSRVVEALTFGIDTGPKLTTNVKGTINDFFDVDWSLANGDVDLVFDRQERSLKIGFTAAAFLSTTEVLLLTDRDAADRVRLLSYDLDSKRLVARAFLPTITNPRMTVVGDIVFIVSFEGMYRVNLKNGEVIKLLVDDVDLSSAEYEVGSLSDSSIALAIKRLDDQGKTTGSLVIAVDVANGTYKIVGSGSGAVYAGTSQ